MTLYLYNIINWAKFYKTSNFGIDKNKLVPEQAFWFREIWWYNKLFKDVFPNWSSCILFALNRYFKSINLHKEHIESLLTLVYLRKIVSFWKLVLSKIFYYNSNVVCLKGRLTPPPSPLEVFRVYFYRIYIMLKVLGTDIGRSTAMPLWLLHLKNLNLEGSVL